MTEKAIRWIARFDFTMRQAEIAELLAKGLSDKEIGEQLFISKKSVKFHNTSIYRKAGLAKKSSQKRMKLSLLLREFDESRSWSHENYSGHLPDCVRGGPQDLIPGNQGTFQKK